jgi:predicted MPP superfamily phosphohydrolase
MDPFLKLRLLHVAVALALGGACLLAGRWPRVIGVGRLALTAAVLAFFFAVEWRWLRGNGLCLFGMMHFRFLDLLLVLPALALGLLCAHALARPAVRLTGPGLVLTAATLAAPLLAIYAKWVEPFDLRLEQARVALDEERAGTAPLRIGVLADLQATRVTDYERDAISRLLETAPDLVFVTGDVIQLRSRTRYEEVLPSFRELLSRLHAPGGVYFVTGDTEKGPSVDELLRGTGIVRLENELVQVEIHDRRVTIAGLGLKAHTLEEGKALLRRLEEDPGEADLRLLLAHRPDTIFAMRDPSRVDLLVCGHTHGGQVQLPFLGPLLTGTGVPRHIAAGGLHEWRGRRIYVSRGVGVERAPAPRVRFLAPPEISLLTLE